MTAEQAAPVAANPARRVLLILTRDPRGQMTGRKMVLSTIIVSLRDLGHDVTIAHFGAANENQAPDVAFVSLIGASGLKRILSSGLALIFGRRSANEALYDSRHARLQVSRLIAERKIDLVITDMIRTAPYGQRTGLPWIADLDDLLSARYDYMAGDMDRGDNLLGYFEAPLLRRLMSVLARVQPLVLRREAAILRRREIEVTQQADLVSLVSEAEAESLANRSGVAVVSTPMAVPGPPDLQGVHPRPREMAFLGGLDYGPNFTSVQAFERDVLPALLAQGIEDIRLDVIGSSGAKHRIALSDRIELRGYIDNLDREMQNYRMLLVPRTAPGGVKTKIIVAALNGTLVLAHVTALDGMGLEPGKTVLAWSTADELAALIVSVRSGSVDVPALTNSARAWAVRRYGPARLRTLWQSNISLCLARAQQRLGTSELSGNTTRSAEELAR